MRGQDNAHINRLAGRPWALERTEGIMTEIKAASKHGWVS